jgi:hypothetical protein
MATRGDLRASRYGRRSILRPLLGLALAPFLVGAACAEDEVEKADAARMPPQPGDQLVFLSGPNKGQVVRLDNLAAGGPQVQVFPVGPDGTIRNGTPLNLVILVRFTLLSGFLPRILIFSLASVLSSVAAIPFQSHWRSGEARPSPFRRRRRECSRHGKVR